MTFKKLVLMIVMSVFFMITLISVVSANDADVKTYVISATGDKLNAITQHPMQIMFWELPEIRAGQRREGGFVLSNTAEFDVTVKLEQVRIPYEDEEALRYLMSLKLTVTGSGGTLYDGSYAALAGDNGLNIDIKLASGEKESFNVVIQGAFSENSNPVALSDMSTWNFSAQHTYAGKRNWAGFFIIAGILLVTLVGCGIIFAISAHRRGKK